MKYAYNPVIGDIIRETRLDPEKINSLFSKYGNKEDVMVHILREQTQCPDNACRSAYRTFNTFSGSKSELLFNKSRIKKMKWSGGYGK